MGTNDPRDEAIYDPRGMVGRNYKEDHSRGTTKHCFVQNMKALGLVVSEKKIVLCFFP